MMAIGSKASAPSTLPTTLFCAICGSRKRPALRLPPALVYNAESVLILFLRGLYKSRELNQGLRSIQSEIRDESVSGQGAEEMSY